MKSGSHPQMVSDFDKTVHFWCSLVPNRLNSLNISRQSLLLHYRISDVRYFCAMVGLIHIIVALSFMSVVSLGTHAKANDFHTITSRQASQKPLIIKSIDSIPKDAEKQKERVEVAKLKIHPPLKGKLHISSKFGKRRNPVGRQATEYHFGLDLSAKAGTPIYAMLPGTVEAIGYDHRSGNYIKLRHGNFTVSYCHLIRKPKLPIGTLIPAGTSVAHVGSTGRSTGPHLHITLKHNGQVIDPAILFSFLP